MKVFRDYTNNLDEETKEALELYTNEYITNKTLKIILNAFEKGPRVRETFTVYRGASRYTPDKKGKIMSTSTDINVGKDFTIGACCLYIITLAPGDYTFLPIEDISTEKDEYEVLLPPGYLSVQLSEMIDGVENVYCTYIPENSTIISTYECLDCVDTSHVKIFD